MTSRTRLRSSCDKARFPSMECGSKAAAFVSLGRASRQAHAMKKRQLRFRTPWKILLPPPPRFLFVNSPDSPDDGGVNFGERQFEHDRPGMIGGTSAKARGNP